jgi:hypothetical protein
MMRRVRRQASWTLSLALAVAGSQAAHALTYRIVAPDAHERAHLLADTGHAYLSLLPLVLALCTAAALAALWCQFRATAREGLPAPAGALRYAILPVAVFALQEHFERLVHDGSFPTTLALQRTFLLGVALQLPFAVLAYLLARALLRAVSAIAGRVARARPFAARPPQARRPPAFVPFRRFTLALGFGTRGPPLPV